MSMRDEYASNGYVHLRGFLERGVVEEVRQEAISVFVTQLRRAKLIGAGEPDESTFELAMARLFATDMTAFVNCGKQCQHLIGLHRLSLSARLVDQVRALGVERPIVCTRPVMYFNARALASSEAYYKTPPHQDWRSMQGSLNSMVIWIPLVDIDRALGALEIVPGSHLRGLLDTKADDWYRRIEGATDAEFVSVEVAQGDALFFSSLLLHRSGDNVTPTSIRWSCHFRYNDLDEASFVERGYPNPYVYKPQQELITPGFPTPEQVADMFGQRVTARSS